MLITGGGTGLGKAMSRRFLELGARLTICGRRAEVLAETKAAILAGLFAVLLAGCASETMRKDRLTAFVEEVLYGGPFDAPAPPDDALPRWTSPLYVAFADDRAEAYRTQVQDLLERFTRLSGIPAHVVPSDKAANVRVSFSPEADFVVLRQRVPCYAQYRAEVGEMILGIIRIGKGDTPAVTRCLSHEFYHIFGLRYHSARVRSILSPVHGETSPTPWDDLALQVLYDIDLRPDLSRAQALPILHATITRLIERS